MELDCQASNCFSSRITHEQAIRFSRNTESLDENSRLLSYQQLQRKRTVLSIIQWAKQKECHREKQYWNIEARVSITMTIWLWTIDSLLMVYDLIYKVQLSLWRKKDSRRKHTILRQNFTNLLLRQSMKSAIISYRVSCGLSKRNTIKQLVKWALSSSWVTMDKSSYQEQKG